MRKPKQEKANKTIGRSVIVASVTLSLALASLMAGCGSQGTSASNATSAESASTSAAVSSAATKGTSSLMTYEEATSALDTEYSDRDSDTGWESREDLVKIDLASFTSGQGATLADGVLTITQAGTYDITGTCTKIVVDAADSDKVQLVLDNATVANDKGCAIYGKNADKLFVTTAKGTSNTVSDGTSYTETTDNGDDVNAAIFATCDLTLNGEGSLTIKGNKEHAVHSKDDLVVAGGTYDVTSKEDGLRGKDSVKIADGTFSIESGEDAVKSSEDGSDDKGYIIIDGGTFAITAGDDAVHAETVLGINDGTVDIENCNEGLEGEKIFVNGGDVEINSGDDGINAVARGESSEPDMGGFGQGSGRFGGTAPDASSSGSAGSDAAQRPDAPSGTSASPGQSYGESGSSPATAPGDGQQRTAPPGSNGDVMTPPDNLEQNVKAPENVSDDNVISPEDFGSAGSEHPNSPDASQAAPGGTANSMFESNDDLLVSINGGKLVVRSGGDGIDANGNFEMTGGEAYVYAPSNSDNSALDVNGQSYANGGTFVGTGSNQMACGFTQGSQASVFSSTDDYKGTITVKDSSGNVLATLEGVEGCQSIVATAPGMKEGDTIEISATEGAAMTATASTEHDSAQMGFGKQRGGDGFPSAGSSPSRDRSQQSA